MNFLQSLNEFIDYSRKAGCQIHSAAVAVTERYARRKLRLRKSMPLMYRGLSLRCVGSKRWRRENA